MLISEANDALSLKDTFDLRSAIESFLNYTQFRKRRSLSTVSTYRGILHGFLSIVGNLETDKITAETVDTYANIISVRNPNTKTYRNKLVAVRCLIAFLYKYDKCSLKPELIELPAEQNVEANFLTQAEAKRLLRYVKDFRDRAMILTLLRSGVRVSELTDLHVGDIYKRSVAVREGKGSKSRVTFISKDAEDAIKDYLGTPGRSEGYLFPNPNGARLSRVVVARKVKYYAHKAGIEKKVTAHTLRHTFATTLLDRGARIEDVQVILGHASLRTTRIYLHFLNPDLQRRYNRVMNKFS